jgi:NADH-quinone oxidoreductase subunit N
MAIAANNAAGGRALLYYLVPYAAATVGSFAVVAARERELGKDVTVDDLAGLGWERPFLGVALWTFVLSFAGFPLTGGFLGKFAVFSAVYEAGWWWLVVIGVVATAVSLPYYLAIVRAVFLREPRALGGEVVAAGGAPPRELALQVGVAASLAVVLGSFVLVQPLFDLARNAIDALPL